MKRTATILASLAMTTPALAGDDHFQSADDQIYVQPTATPTPKEDDDGTPRLDGLRILGEVFAGSATGFGGLYVGGAIGVIYFQEYDPCAPKFCDLLPGAIGAEVGLVATVPIGVYFAGSSGDQTGSFGATALGSLIGGAAGTATFLTGIYTGQEAVAWLGVGVGVAGPLIGSVIGFNLTRRYDEPRAPTKSVHIAPIVGPTSFGVAGVF